jgi:chorismate mutase
MPDVNDEIKNLRADIDKLDREILNILKQRILNTEKIGKIKKTDGTEIFDKQREKEILSNLIEYGKNLGIDENLIVSLWQNIIDHSHKVQNDCDEK